MGVHNMKRLHMGTLLIVNRNRPLWLAAAAKAGQQVAVAVVSTR